MPSPDVFASIFSPGDTSEFDSDNGSPVIVSSPVHSGSYAMKCKDDDDYAVVNVSEDELVARCYLRYDTEPEEGEYQIIRNIHFLGDAGTTPVARVYMESRPAGKLFRLHIKYPSVTDYYYWFDWKINTWYCIELYFKKDAASGRAIMIVNDAAIIDTYVEESGYIDTSGAPTIDRVQFGIADYANPATPFTNVFMDCIAIMDTYGPIGTHSSFESGFETADFSEFDAPVGSPQITDLKLHCGNYSAEMSVSPGGSEGVYKNLGHHKEIFVQFEVKFQNATPPVGEYYYFAYIRESTDSTNILALFLYNDGGTVKWGYTYRSAGSTVTDLEDTEALDPDDDTWYCVDVEIVMSSRDGDAEGSYNMSVDGTLLDDIDVSGIDTDYTGVSVFRFITYTSASGGCTNYYDCITVDTEDIGACHAAGASEPESLETATDCVPVLNGDWLQVFRNCNRTYLENVVAESGERGISKLTIPYWMSAQRGDLFHVFVQGSTILQGRVVSLTKNRRQGTKTLQCQSKTARLYGKYVLNQTHSTYSGQDIGAIVKDLIDYYFDGLFTSNNVNENVGVTVSDFDCYDKSVGDAMEDLAKRGSVAFYVDQDNDVHLFVKGKEKSGAVFDKTNIVGDIIVDEVGEVINKVIVKGITGVTGEAGSGIPEVIHSDRRITSSEEAQEVAEALLENYGVTVTIKFSVTGFYSLRQGKGAKLDMPIDGYDNEDIVINSVSYNLTPGSCQTDIVVGELPISYEHLIRQVFKDIAEQKVNRISNHTGTDSGDGDPALEYNDILSTGLSGEVRVQTSNVTLQSGVCGSESDAANMALVHVNLEYGTVGGGSGWYQIKISNTTTGENIERIAVYMDGTGVDHYYKRALVLDDYSGDTVQVDAEGFAGCDVYVKTEIIVRQLLQHSHDVSQALQHEFD